MRGPLVRFAVLGGAAAVLVLLPFVTSDQRTAQLSAVGAYVVAIAGLDVLLRQSGQLSLASGAFMAVGGYTTAILVAHHGVRDLWTVPIAAGVAAVAGIAVGLPALRLRGVAFPLATFGLAIAVPPAAARFSAFTGGPAGIDLTPHRATAVYALTWSVAGVLALAAWAITASTFGRRLRATRDNEIGAAAAGIGPWSGKALALAIAAGSAGVAGSLLTLGTAQIHPDTFPVALSPVLLAAAALGLYGSIRGAVAGALLVEYLPSLVGRLPHVDHPRAGPATLVYGAGVIMLALGLPLVLRVGRAVADRRYPRR